jgi:hypothetical protein
MRGFPLVGAFLLQEAQWQRCIRTSFHSSGVSLGSCDTETAITLVALDGSKDTLTLQEARGSRCVSALAGKDEASLLLDDICDQTHPTIEFVQVDAGHGTFHLQNGGWV